MAWDYPKNETRGFRRSAGTLWFFDVGTHRICLQLCKEIPEFLVIFSQLAVRRLTEIAGVCFFSVYQKHGRANLASLIRIRVRLIFSGCRLYTLHLDIEIAADTGCTNHKQKQHNYRNIKKSPKTRCFRGKLFFSDIRLNYRLLNCGARRAALRPYFLRSFIRGSRVRNPAALRAGL